jgi:penicillin amidase
VIIKRDSLGVICVEGQSVEDVILASGFAAAQDRLWQMEVIRLLGKGRLSRVFGRETLEIDKLFITLGMDSLTNRIYKTVSDDSKLWLEKYSTGINLYIQKYMENLPIEFTLMKVKPALWTSQDCLLQNRMMAWLLNFNWKADLLYWQLSRSLPYSLLRDILPDWKNYPAIIGEEGNLALLIKLNELVDKIYLLTGIFPAHWGSNNWVVSPKLSQNGSVLLANDPHLALQLPSIWMEMGLHAPGFNVAGFCLPGTPGIIIGRNAHIAWGVTNGMIDDSDYFVEKIDTLQNLYWMDNRQRELSVQRVQIEIKDQSPAFFSVYKTEKGPIFNHIFPNLQLPNDISFKWVGWEDSDELHCFIKLASARNWQEFNNALRYFVLPAQNFVYGDRYGNIGYRLGGKIPIRSYASGLIPTDGFNSKNRWNGWITFEQMPHIFNPESGYIVTANHQIEKNYPYYLSELWEPPYRAMRLNELIGRTEKLSQHDFKNIQMDVTNLLAKEVVPIIFMALKSHVMESEDSENKLFFLFENWNFSSSSKSIAAAYYEVLQYFLIKNIFEDEMGEAVFKTFTDLPNFYLRIFVKVLKNSASEWFDDIETPLREDRNSIINKSSAEALNYLKDKLGENIENWNWGQINQLELKHMFGRNRITRNIFNRGSFPVAGCGTTINVSTYFFNNPFEMMVGPSLRYIVDWGEDQGYYSIIPGGNSGNIFSPFYDNQIEDWKAGNLKRVLMETESSRFEFFLIPG